jgi:predicted ArsR family transcriptional regulator
MAKTITKSEAILKAVKRGPKKGLTAAEIADRTGVSLATVKAYLSAFKAEGYVQVVGKVETGKRGRPALRYAAV